MKSSKTIFIFVITIILAKPIAGAENIQHESALEIYLPREITVDTNTIRLGQVGIIKGEQTIVSAAENIGLGVFSMPGQKITIDKQTILGRLAANNIDASKVSLKGAERITVSWQQIISGREFIKQAIVVLKKVPAYSKAAEYYPVKVPADLVVPSKAREIKLVPHLSADSTTTLARIEFTVSVDGKEIGRRQATVRIKNAQQKNDAKPSSAEKQVQSDIENPVLLPQSDGVRIQVADIAEEQSKKDASGAVSASRSSVVVNRNQNVLIKIDRGGLQVSAAGKAQYRRAVQAKR